MAEEKDSAAEEPERVLYVKDRPVWTIFKRFLLVMAASVIILFAVGFISGLTGWRTPYISSGVISSQLDKLTHKTAAPEWNELQKNS